MNYRLLAAAALFVPALAAAQTAPRLRSGRLSRARPDLGSDAFEGRGPATRARDQDGRLHHRADARGRAAARRRLVNGKRGWTQAVPLAQVGHRRHAAADARPSTASASR